MKLTGIRDGEAKCGLGGTRLGIQLRVGTRSSGGGRLAAVRWIRESAWKTFVTEEFG
jgi:hypothetical protein